MEFFLLYILKIMSVMNVSWFVGWKKLSCVGCLFLSHVFFYISISRFFYLGLDTKIFNVVNYHGPSNEMSFPQKAAGDVIVIASQTFVVCRLCLKMSCNV